MYIPTYLMLSPGHVSLVMYDVSIIVYQEYAEQIKNVLEVVTPETVKLQ